MSSYIFIDARITGIDAQLADLAADATTVILDPLQDAIDQMTAALAGHNNLDAIHIVSHGADGMLYLGNTVLGSHNLAHYSAQLAAIGNALNGGGDILLYGCDVAASAAGQQFIEQLAAYTHADVAASTNATGASSLGGDWQLEAASGQIETSTLSAEGFAGLLDVINGDNNANNLVGTVNADQITGLGGDDTIDGGAGSDQSIYGGSSAGYTFSLLGNNIIVTDTNLANGNDGADRLTSIEAAQFTDGTIGIGSVAEFRVNTATANDQTGPAIATLANGGFVIAWESNLQDGSGVGVYAQRFDAAGVALGAEFRVNTVTANDQTGPAIATFSDDGFVIAWESDLQDGSGLGVYAQRYSAAGAALGAAFRVNTTTANDQDSISIIELSNDNFVVAWNSLNQDGSGYGVYAQRYSQAGATLGAEFRVNTTTANDQVGPELSSLGDGFIATWTSGAAGATDVFAQRYNASGGALGAQFRVNTTLANDQESPVVAELGNGDFVVAWNSLNQDGSGLGVYAQRYNASGVAQGGEFRVNTTTAGAQDSPSITGLDDGGFVVIWNALNQDGSLYGIYGQRFNATGVAQGTEFRVNTTTANDQDSPSVTPLDDGGFMVTWESNLQDGGGFGIYAQRYDASGNAVAATLTGDASANVITWSGTQSVVIDGGAGADQLFGGGGNDTYHVDGQTDIVFENVGAGTDTVISTASFYLYDNIENLILAAGAGDIFGSANAANNILTGNDGVNLLIGWDGNDTVRGGEGNDIIYGVNNDDSLFGEAGIDVLVAGEGNDTLDGGADPDEMYGENGNDVLYGGSGFVTDILVGGAGNDTLDGSASLASGQPRNQGDFDYLYGQLGDDTYYVDTPSDLTFEFNGLTEGNDTVIADITGAGYYLYDSTENLILTGNTSFGVGNGHDNQITGSALGTFLLGGAGNDTINGMAGNDVLFGEAGADTFVLARGTNADVIGDFTPGVDKIQLVGVGYNSFAQVQPHMVQNGGTTAIDLGAGDLVVLNGVAIASLSAGDFLFA